MGKMLIHLLITALAILGVSRFVPGIHVDTFTTALLVAFVLAVINLVVRPVISVLTLPINVLTLGLFTFILNGILFWFASYFVHGFKVDNLMAAVIGALAVSVLSWFANFLLHTS